MATPVVNTRALSASTIASSVFDQAVEDYGAFTGANITAHVNHVPIGSLMGISYTIHTEKQAQYTFGNPNARNFSTGKRGIAGSLIFNQFDRSALLSIFTGSNLIGQPMVSAIRGGTAAFQGSVFSGRYSDTSLPGVGTYAPLADKTYAAIPDSSSAFNTNLSQDISDAYTNALQTPLDYSDQLPPFDVTLTMVDSRGKGAFMVIGGIEIMNEGGGFTVDDMTAQTAYTYVARFIRPLTPIVPSTGQTVSSGALLP